MASGQPLVLPSDALGQRIARSGFQIPGEVRANGTVSPLGHLEWPALLRKLDRIDPSYRD